MNREIKFRVWDKWHNRFVPDNDPEFPFLFSNKSEVYRTYGLSDCFSVIREENYILQQYTTRKDSKGIEIYEGDIVNVNGGNHIIEWRGAGFAATWSDYNLDSCWFVGGGPVVIGNIFENLELAEKARKSPRV